MFEHRRSAPLLSANLTVVLVWAGLLLSALIGCAGAFYLDQPVLLALPLILMCVMLALRYALQLSLILLICGPVLLSTFPVGSMTLDNLATIAGIALALWAALVRVQLPLVGVAAFPLSLALAVALTTAALGSSDVAGVLRFVGIGLGAWVAHQLEAEKPGAPSRIVVFVLTIGALSVILQPILGFPDPYIDREGDGGFRYGGVLGHPNFAAYVFAVGALWVLARTRLGFWNWAVTALFVAAMLVTGSRTAFILFVAAAVLLLVNDLRRAIAIVAALLLFAFSIGSTMVTRIEALLNSSGSQENSGTWRIEQWQRALSLRNGNEFFGIGWQRIPELTPNGLGAHSGYVQLLVELGLAGAVIAGIGISIAIATTLRTRLSAVLWIYLLGASTTDPVFLYPSVAAISVVVLALDAPRRRLVEVQSSVTPSHGLLTAPLRNERT